MTSTPEAHRPAYSARYNAALALAAQAHAAAQQIRKGKGWPYIVHPVHVSRILERIGAHEDLVLAGLLHDVLEDTQVTDAEMVAIIGEDVTALVRGVSETKREGDVVRPWEVRKAETIAHLHTAPIDVVVLKAADTLHNTSEMLEDVRREGPARAFAHFRRGATQQLGYYSGVAGVVRARLGEAHPLAAELMVTTAALSQACAADAEPAVVECGAARP